MTSEVIFNTFWLVLLTLVENHDEIASVEAWLLCLDSAKLGFTCLSYFVVVVEDVSKSLSNV